jgi:PAS domain S-box-containing protein
MDTLRDRAVLETLRDAVAVTDPAGLIRWTNAAHARLYGVAREDALGQPLCRFSALGAARQLELAQEMRDALARHGHWSGRLHAMHRNGTRIVTDTCVSLVTGEDGDHWVSVQRDVTEQRQMEEAALATLCIEQHRVGVQLHESLGQELAGAAMLVRALRRQAAAGRAPDPQLLGDVEGLLQSAVASCRGLAQGMSPFIIDDDGLGVALQDLAQRSARGRALGVVAQACSDSAQLRGNSAYHVFRITSLALDSALQREAVAAAEVQVWREADRIAVAVVADGIETSVDPQSVQQRQLRHWLRTLGGAMEPLEASAGRSGVIMLLPLPEYADAVLHEPLLRRA